MSFETTSNGQSTNKSAAFATSFETNAYATKMYGWDVERVAPSEKIRKQAHYSTSKNLYLTQKETKRRLK